MTGPSLQHRGEYWLFRLMRWKWGWLPEALAVRLGALTGLFAGCVLRIRRRDVDRHLALAFPDRAPAWRDRVARASYAHLGREAAILFRMGRWTPEQIVERVTFRGLSELRRAAEAGRGAVLLTGHLGAWEFAGAALAAAGIRLDVVGKRMANRRFEQDLFGLREELGMGVIEMGSAAKRVLRALRDGRVVAILGDQNAHKSDVFVSFFGRQAATARGPALFAIRTGAPVFFGIVLRDPGWAQRYTATVWLMRFRPTGDVEADTRSLLAEYMQALEDAVREAPEQYFWQHKRWKTRPPEELESAG